MLLASCKDEANGGSYPRGTEVRVLVTDASSGELLPIWEALGEALGIGIVTVDSEAEGFDVIVGSPSELMKMRDGLLELSAYSRQTADFDKYLSDNAFVYLSSVADATGSLYIAAAERAVANIPTVLMRADWIRELLDGEGEFRAEKSELITEAYYTPKCETDRPETVEIYRDGRVERIEKKYTIGGNIVYAMNAAIACEALDGVAAVNMLRRYIDEVHRGYYGTRRSDLFLGDSAAWNADELVALLRCMRANAYTLTGTDELSCIFFEEGDDHLLALAGSLFGARGLSDGGYLYVDQSGSISDARDDTTTYRALDAMNEMIKEGLVSLGCDNGAVTYTDLADVDEQYDVTLPPLAYWDDGEEEGPSRFVEIGSVLCDRALAISSDVKENADKLAASLALLNCVYTEAFYDNVFGAASTETSLTEEQNERTVLMRLLMTYGMIRSDELSFTENPWYSTPFDNIELFVEGNYPELSRGAEIWGGCLMNDPLRDIAVNGYTSLTISGEHMTYAYGISYRMSEYEDELNGAMQKLFNLYRYKK